jgi:hypothetical protein
LGYPTPSGLSVQHRALTLSRVYNNDIRHLSSQGDNASHFLILAQLLEALKRCSLSYFIKILVFFFHSPHFLPAPVFILPFSIFNPFSDQRFSTMCNGQSNRESQGGTIAVLSSSNLSPHDKSDYFSGELFFRSAESSVLRSTEASFQAMRGCDTEALTGCWVVIQ